MTVHRSQRTARADPGCPPFLFRRILFLALPGFILSACVLFTPAPPEKVNLRPAPPRLPTYTVSGRAIIATPGPVSVTVRPVDPDEVHQYFQKRPHRVNPFQEMADRITPFHLRIDNRSQHHVTFDPGLALLKDEKNRGAVTLDANDLYQALSDRPALLQAAQGGVFTGYLVIPPDQHREGLLIFPAYPKDAKALFLQFNSFYAGTVPYPLIFEFEVIPEGSKK